VNGASYAHKPRTIAQRILSRLRRIAHSNGDQIVTSRADGSFYLVDAETGGLVWPDSMSAIGTGATLAQLRDYIEGSPR
jgi:hypothetical protein